ncbi:MULTISPECIES: AraC family transcriptional regulator [Streptosporangium]|uniref:AraC-like DNA-binding protein n=1 Tax=Streptosporangium brasiliense TaxID=47480 RepID=A0ABT9QYL4_9ACTN|nr:AraC family transcriptional regulator [Streptosporangium brasiliense]MDP9862037.1 AraC-like DNA-binding protein [Streptosporangium brasiliense]
MDVIGDLLTGVRARGAAFGRSIASPPWGIKFAVSTPLSVATMVRGRAWVTGADGRARPLRPGDVALVKGGRPYVIADSPATAPAVTVYGEECEGDVVGPGPDAYGAAGGEALLVTGAYRMAGDLSARLLSALPELLVVPGDDVRPAPALDLISAEVTGSEPGSQVALDRLLDLLLVLLVRAWFARPEAGTPAWYAALADPQIGRALRLVHDRPGAPWSVASLAEAVGMSRAAFARRFAALVGRPPLAYLTEWRMELAADLLRRPGVTVAAAAEKVGYADAFGFSAAFKRVRGVPPSRAALR